MKHLITILFLSWQLAISQITSIGDVSTFIKTENGIILETPPAKVRINFLSPDVIRVCMSKNGLFRSDHSWAVINDSLEENNFELKETTDKIFLTTSKLTVRIKKSPCRISILDQDGKAISEDDSIKGMCWSGQEISVWKKMPRDEYYFGLGEKAGSIDRKWKAYSMWNTDIPAYRADTDPLYQTIPFFYGLRKGRTYGIFFDNTFYSHFDFGKTNREQYSFGAVDGDLNYYFIYGPSPIEVLTKFSKLVGTIPLPPRWSLGYQQCRWSYYPESKVRELAATFRQKKIPCDAIYLDIHYMDGYRCFTWDTSRFPNPKKMINDLSSDGFKIVTIIDPGIKNDTTYWVYQSGMKGNHFVKHPDGQYFIGTVWPGNCVFPDFTRRETREWWGSLYQVLIENGVKGFWNDMNEPSVFNTPNKTFDLDVVHDGEGYKSDHREYHNIYGMQMVRGTYEGVLKIKPNERPFVLTRANYAGGNRYSAAWTGDNISSWEHLEMAVPMCLSLSISGQPFVGTDIGGFVGNPSGELYTRWLQLGVFLPLMRTHTEINSNDQEPWSYGAKYEDINKKSIELRYQLLPYLYTQFYKASVNGTPIIRPIFFDYPDEEDNYLNDDEFLFGEALLVAPVLWEGENKRDVKFPTGDWYNYWTGEKYINPKYLRFDSPIDNAPLFAKAGSIIPTQQIVQFTDEAPINPLTIKIFPSENASTILYEDDGNSFEYKKGYYCLRKISLETKLRLNKILLENPEGKYRPPDRTILIELYDAFKPNSIKINNAEIISNKDKWYYNEANRMLTIKFIDTFKKILIEIRE